MENDKSVSGGLYLLVFISFLLLVLVYSIRAVLSMLFQNIFILISLFVFNCLNNLFFYDNINNITNIM